MESHLNSRLICSPVDVLKKKFIGLSGLSTKDLRALEKDQAWSHTVIRKISSATSTAPRYWYHLNCDWQFHKYLSTRKPTMEIKAISARVQTSSEIQSPGYILETKFLKPTRRSYCSLERLIGVSCYALNNLVNGKHSFTPLTSYRLGRSFDTDTKYWLDLQSAYEVHILLRNPRRLETKTINSLTRYRDSIYARGVRSSPQRGCQSVHPGKYLLHQFIESSGIPEINWRHLFCLSMKHFKKILSGKTEIPLLLIIKISSVFNTDVGFWIELQNRFLAMKAEHDYETLSRKPQRVVLLTTIETSHCPHRILVEDFLKPMHISIRHFAKHIGLSGGKFERLKKGRRRIDYELAIRIGQALDIAPHYWINLQLEFDIYSFEKGKGELSLYLS